MSQPWSRRLKAAGFHLLASAVIAAICSWMVFRVWYPKPFDALSGGLDLVVLVISVDVVLGPLLTAIVASPAKPLAELRRDLALIVIVQLAGLAYGLWTIAEARPVYLSFEVDRFRVVSAADVDTASMSEAPEGFRSLPWTGPRLIAAVKPSDPAEQLRSIDLGLAGVDLSMVPRNWRDFASQSESAWRAARPVGALLEHYPSVSREADRIIQRAGRQRAEVRFLPVLSRRQSWVALLAPPSVQVIGYLPVEGFF